MESGIKNLEVTELGGREEHTTNNRMELTAVIKALQKLKDVRSKILVYSDSSYVVNGITKWVFGWQRNNWKTVQKKEVEKNEKELAAIAHKHDLQTADLKAFVDKIMSRMIFD